MGSSPPICLSVGNGDQAPGRVDVPDGDFLELDHKFQMSAGAFAAAAKSTELVGSFVRALNGSSPTITVRREYTILDLAQLLSVRHWNP